MDRDKFTGGDQQYLRDDQYRDPVKLQARADLHAKYGTAGVGWFPWVVGQIEWPQGGDVLEVGCGPGWLWAEAAADLPGDLRITLTDLSPGMVAVAGERASRHFGTVEAREADAQSLPFADGAFDVVVANHMLYHVPEPARAVAELARVLRTGGVLEAATVGPGHLRELWEIRAEVFGGRPVSGTADAFGSASGLSLLQQDFGTVEWREYEDRLLCTSPDDVLAALTSSPPGEDASPSQLRALRLAVDRRFEAEGGTLPVSKETGAFVARVPLRRH